MRLLFSILATMWFVSFASGGTFGLREEIRSLKEPEDLAKYRGVIINISAKEADRPIIVRPPTLNVLLEEYPGSMKYKTKPAHQMKLTDEEWERFALSNSDAILNSWLSERLPRMAAAYVFSEDERILKHLLAQLSEMASWKPLERPGAISTKQNLKYGPWLGTGWAVRAITASLDILPPDAVPSNLRDALIENLEAEIHGIRQAWHERKLWYTREKSCYSNQWVLPNEGLVLAAIFTGRDKHREAYEAGMTNLLKSLDAQGAKGEFVEGGAYAESTMSSLLSAAEAAAAQGDRRLIDHPYLKKFPIWYIHHLQPGGRIINAFDSKMGSLNPNLLSRFISSVKSPEALWMARQNRTPGFFGNRLAGLSARAAADFPAKEPPLFGVYDFAARINWRSSWDDDRASGFWMRGGHATDAHDHQDRGHVNFSIGGREVLIEAGLASYGIPEHPTFYRSVAGHNVLQVGNAPPEELNGLVARKAGQILDPAHRSAPITVKKIDAKGGAAFVDVSGCYEMTERWVRQAAWDKESVEVKDEVTLRSPDYVTFRWHLAAPAGVAPEISDGRVRINGIEVAYDADSPVTVTVEPMPGYDAHLKQSIEHACVVIRSKQPVKALALNSRIRLKP